MRVGWSKRMRASCSYSDIIIIISRYGLCRRLERASDGEPSRRIPIPACWKTGEPQESDMELACLAEAVQKLPE